jgi:hypothetical protein
MCFLGNWSSGHGAYIRGSVWLASPPCGFVDTSRERRTPVVVTGHCMDGDNGIPVQRAVHTRQKQGQAPGAGDEAVVLRVARRTWGSRENPVAPPATGMSEGVDVGRAGQQRISGDALHQSSGEGQGCQLCQTQPVLAVPLHGGYCISNPKKRKMRGAYLVEFLRMGILGTGSAKSGPDLPP